MNKFKESLTTAVFTTVYVVKDNSLITNVFHYQDGSWQFSGKEQDLKDSDYKVVSLSEILSIDETLEELADMPIEFCAKRNSKKDNWVIIRLAE
jgi:hypothetical protein